MRRGSRFGGASKPLWLALGFLSLALGAIGVVLPLLPTTPFVILAAFAFTRCSPRLARWLEDHRLFGPMIHDWRTHGAIALKYKLMAVIMMSAALALSVAMGLSVRLITIQSLVMLCAASFVLTRPSR